MTTPQLWSELPHGKNAMGQTQNRGEEGKTPFSP